MKLGLFGLLIVMGLGVFMGYVGHDTLKSAGASASHAVDTVTDKVAKK
jgi:hypothetical protein